MSFIAIAIGAAAVAGAISYGGARKNELKANKASKKASNEAALRRAELAARERRSFVPGFSGGSDNIPGYSDSGYAALGPQPGSAGRNPAGFYGDMDVVEGAGYGTGSEIRFDASGNVIFNEAAITRSVQKKLKTNKAFKEYAKSLPTTEDGRPIFPDPNTPAGSEFYKQLPKSVAAMAGNPKYAQMYKGSNIVNPYANIVDLSAVLEDVSDIYQDRTGLLKDRSDMFKGTAELGVDLSGQEDLSKRFGDLTTGMEDLSGRISDLRPGAKDYSGLATDSSVLASNPYANLQVATQAADLKAQQSDQALANTLSTIRATGAGAGGATAIAQAALQSKLGVAATIEQQETRNVQARAEGQQQIEQIRMSESQRLQNISLTEKLRLESLRQTEGRRIDETRLTEGRTLRQLGLEEGRSLRGIELEEGRALRGLAVSEGQRMQGLGISDRLREQELQQGESLRLQNAKFNEAQRLQDMDYGEAIRIQSARFNEQQRLQEADSMAREYQFRVAETREQNRLNRLQNMATQSVQTAADLEASKIAARAQRQGALVGAIGGIGAAATNLID